MVSRTVAYCEAAAVDDDSEVGCSKTDAEKIKFVSISPCGMYQVISLMTVILPDGHSAVEEEAHVVRYDCVLLIVFRTLQFQHMRFRVHFKLSSL